MNVEAMKAVAEKAYKNWMAENGSPEAVTAWVQKELRGAREQLVRNAFGLEQDTFSRSWQLKDSQPSPILDALAKMAATCADDWVAAMFADGTPSTTPALQKQVRRAYLFALQEAMEKLAQAQAQKDASALVGRVLAEGPTSLRGERNHDRMD